MSIENALQIIEENIDDADFCGPVAPDKITSAEEILGVKFPKSYSLFLKKYGAGDIAGIELFGIIKDPTTDGPMVPNGIWLTLNLREESALPKEFIVVSETGYGPYYVIDTSFKDDNFESPVYIWDTDNQKEKISDSFGKFLYSLIGESI
ncbi:SMI1/KNR4 family protein [Maribacter sp. 2-571]|uniref:SMI1/KNR4 family protein n=1 Tax=Maribacter sp. 2-571 TaxID=3417569 RepID=UPI003D3433B3